MLTNIEDMTMKVRCHIKQCKKKEKDNLHHNHINVDDHS